MKKSILFFLLCLSGITYAQDQLFKKDNSKIDVKIIEINQSEIKYKLFTYQDGPTITISKNEVALIIYQNGVHEVISQTAPTPQPVYTAPQPIVIYKEYRDTNIARDSIKRAMEKELLSTKNLVSMNILDPINGSFNLSYMREFAYNYLHVYVPVSIGFTAPHFTQISNTMFTGYDYNATTTNYNFSVSNFTYTAKSYEIGLGLHFQSSGNRQVTHFVGPYIGQAQFNGNYDKSARNYDPTTGISTSSFSHNYFTMNRLFLMLDNGVLFKATKNFNIMLLVGIGYHIDTFKDEDLTKATNYKTSSQRVIPLNAYKFGVNFGYRF